MSSEDAIKKVVNSSLNAAEAVWEKHGPALQRTAELLKAEASFSESTIPSLIPGHEDVSISTNEVDQFIALVADMRDSSKHLTIAISKKEADVSLLQRVYYETSALLPALAHCISEQSGSVTEFLGDGLLALFQYKSSDQVYSAWKAAKACLDPCLGIVNSELSSRYRLPHLEIGIGLAYSDALVTTVGYLPPRHPKVFGRCVYRASKLADGHNKIAVDDWLKGMWPTGKSGKVKFTERENFKFKSFWADQ